MNKQVFFIGYRCESARRFDAHVQCHCHPPHGWAADTPPQPNRLSQATDSRPQSPRAALMPQAELGHGTPFSVVLAPTAGPATATGMGPRQSTQSLVASSLVLATNVWLIPPALIVPLAVGTIASDPSVPSAEWVAGFVDTGTTSARHSAVRSPTDAQDCVRCVSLYPRQRRQGVRQ